MVRDTGIDTTNYTIKYNDLDKFTSHLKHYLIHQTAI